MKSFYSLLLFVISVNVFPQQVKILKKIDGMMESAKLIRLTNSDSCINLCKEAIHLSKLYDYNEGLTAANYYMACSYFYKNSYDKAIEYSNLSLQYNNYSKISYVDKAYNLLGSIHNNLCNYEKALSYHEKALNISKVSNLRVSPKLVNIAIINSQINKNEKAIRILNEAEKISLSKKDSTTLYYVYLNKGEILLKSDKISESHKYFKKAFKYSNNKYKKVNILNNLATLYLKKSNPDSAKIYIDLSEKHLREYKNLRLKGAYYILMGKYYNNRNKSDSAGYFLKLASNIPLNKRLLFDMYLEMARLNISLYNYNEAIKYCNLILQHNKKPELHDISVNTYKLISSIYHLKKDPKSEYKYFNKYSEKRSTLSSIKLNDVINNTEYIGNQTITKAENQKKTISKDIKKRAYIKIGFTVFCISLSIFITLFFIYHLIIIQKKYNSVLKSINLTKKHNYDFITKIRTNIIPQTTKLINTNISNLQIFDMERFVSKLFIENIILWNKITFHNLSTKLITNDLSILISEVIEDFTYIKKSEHIDINFRKSTCFMTYDNMLAHSLLSNILYVLMKNSNNSTINIVLSQKESYVRLKFILESQVKSSHIKMNRKGVINKKNNHEINSFIIPYIFIISELAKIDLSYNIDNNIITQNIIFHNTIKSNE